MRVGNDGDGQVVIAVGDDGALGGFWVALLRLLLMLLQHQGPRMDGSKE